MARIALILGVAVLGAVTGGILSGALFPVIGAGTFGGGTLLGGALLGGEIGLAGGGLLASIIFPGHSNFNGPQLNDLQVMSSANGAGIPFGYGGFRIGGQIIWSPGLKEHQNSQTTSAKGAPSQTTTTYTYTVSFACAFCSGVANITRLWGDSQLIYDVTGKGGISSNILDTGIQNSNGTFQTTVVTPTIYTGTATQNPDPTVQASEGIDATPAFRDLCYLVYEDFPLSSFGNRLPNIRAEISIATQLSYVKDTIAGVNAQYGTHNLVAPAVTLVDASNRKCYVIDTLPAVPTMPNGQAINLVANDTEPLDSWQPSTAYVVGDEILDKNGDVQVVVAIQSGGVSGSAAYYSAFSSDQPEWQPETVITYDPYNGTYPTGVPGGWTIQWKNLGKGPEAIVVSAQGQFQPILEPGETINVQGLTNGMCSIDGSGNIWSVTQIRKPDTTLFWALQCYDPTTFIAKFRIVLPAYGIYGSGAPTGLSCATNSSGKYLVVMYDYNAGGTTLVYNLSNNSIAYNISFNLPLDFEGNYPTAGINGQMFTAYYGVGYGLTTQTYVASWSPSTGATHTSSNLYGAITSADSRLWAALWNPADSTLLCITKSGCLVKVDPTSLTVISQSADNAVYCISTEPMPGYLKQNGNLPADGSFRCISYDGTSYWLDVYDVNLTLVSHILLDSWFVAEVAGSINNMSFDFDPSTNSILMTRPDDTFYYAASYRVYLERQIVSGQDLGVVVTDILTRAGMTTAQIDVSQITGKTVYGYPIVRNVDAKSILEALCMAYFFDMVETGGKLVAIPRGGATKLSIPEGDLGLSSDKYKLQETCAQEHDLPRGMTVIYADPVLDYQQGVAKRQRNARTRKTKTQTIMSLPLTLQSDQAAQIADIALHVLWQSRNTYTFKLWKSSYLVLDPSDIVNFTYEGLPFTARFTKTSIGQNFVMEVNALSEDARNYLSTLTVPNGSGLGFLPQSFDPPAPTLLFLMDIPLLQDTDAPPAGSTGFYWGMNSVAKDWSGGVLIESTDNSTWGQIGFSGTPMPFGSVYGQLGVPRSPYSWDYVNTLTVAIQSGSLSSTTVIAVLNGANAALIGEEIIQYQNAVLNANGTYTISNLLRGRRGTEWACYEHNAGETFIAISGGLERNIMGTNVIGSPRYFKPVTIGETQDQAQSTSDTFEGNDLKPYAPAQFISPIDSSGNFNFSWVRRTRVGGAWLDGTGTVPLSEEAESYDLDILLLDGGGKNIDAYEISVPSVGNCQWTEFISFFVEVPVVNLTVGPFTITWADGTVANYAGYTFGGPSANVPTSGFLIVHDPNRTGDLNGGSVTYSMEAPTWAHFSSANQPGYFLIGQIVPGPGTAQGTTWPVGPGGSDIVVRSIKGLSSPSFTYTAAAQLQDFGASPNIFPGYVRAKVFQNSAAVGRGFAAQNVAPAGGELIPVFSGGVTSGNATSINGIPIVGTPVSGDVLTFNGMNWVPAPSSGGGSQPRTSVVKTTASLANTVAEVGTLALTAKTFALLHAAASVACRIQLYSTAAYRDVDVSRPVGVLPAKGSQNGIIADFVLSAGDDPGLTWDCSPPLLGTNLDGTPVDQVYYRITNMSGGATTVGVTLVYLPLEA